MQMHKVAIDCGTGETAYQVILHVEKLDGLKQASLDPALRAKTGETLVAALIEKIPTDLGIIERRRGDTLTDGPDSEPAYVSYFTKTGLPAEITHMTNGVWNDAADGTPAIIHYNNFKGRLTEIARAERYDNGTHVKTLNRKERADMAAERTAYLATHRERFAAQAQMPATKADIVRAIPGLKIL